MDYLQYKYEFKNYRRFYKSFKPYYKWITFNTEATKINGFIGGWLGFKPYYKWITFNTWERISGRFLEQLVLNLIINGLPSILRLWFT